MILKQITLRTNIEEKLQMSIKERQIFFLSNISILKTD